MKIDFPKNLSNRQSGIQFLCFLWGMTKKVQNGTIIWNLKYTKKIETNLLSYLGLILNRSYKHNNSIIIIIRNISGEVYEIKDNIMEVLFYKYSEIDENVLKYRYINLKSEIADNEKRNLYRQLKKLNLKYYKEIKILLSEFIANINMHTDLKECAIAGYVNINENTIIFSICNMGKTIKQNVRETGSYEFENDSEAIIWALKKTNTTRKKNESGGLGLYLLRKYLALSNGTGQIVSGKSIIKLKGQFYDRENVNNIILNDGDVREMKSFFTGALITIEFPYIKNNFTNEKEVSYLKAFSVE